MDMFFSPSTGGFYSSMLHAGFIPEDAVPITYERHQALLAGQAAGQEIAAGEDGAPVLRAPVHPPMTADEARAQRDRLLSACDWTQIADSPLGTQARADWAAYRRALRDVPGQDGFPAAITWPDAPA